MANPDPALARAMLEWVEVLERQADGPPQPQKVPRFPEKAPDYSTVWQFRERLDQTGKDREPLEELQRQLDEEGLRIGKGVVQDATFIAADPGPSGNPRGEQARIRSNYYDQII